MDNLNDLKATWRTANTDSLPDAQFIMNVVKPFRDNKVNRKRMIITFSLVMCVFFSAMMYHDRGGMLSTLIGEGLLIVCLLILAYTNIRSIKRFYTLNDCSNKEFMSFLEQTRKNQVYYYKRTQVVCMVLYSVALIFYPFELFHANTASLVVFYVALLAGLSIFWLVTRPKSYKKESAKLQKLIDETNKIIQQFEKNETN